MTYLTICTNGDIENLSVTGFNWCRDLYPIPWMKICGIWYRNLTFSSSVEYKTLVVPARKEIEYHRLTNTNRLPQ
jgi:hypothetical protein